MTTLGLLVIGLLLPQMVLALDAETQALERAALCQAMPYRVECGGPPRRPAQPIAAPQSPARARPPPGDRSAHPGGALLRDVRRVCADDCGEPRSGRHGG